MRTCCAVLVLIASSHAHADPARDVAKVIDTQFSDWKAFRTGGKPTPDLYGAAAPFAMTNGGVSPELGTLGPETPTSIFGPATLDQWKLANLHVGIAHDGKSAWASFDANVVVLGPDASSAKESARGSELLAKSGERWQVIGAAWSRGLANDVANRNAKADKLGKLDAVADKDSGEQALLDAFKAMLASGLDSEAGKRAELFAIGSAPGELTTSGKVLAGGFKAAWVGHVTLDGPMLATMAPSGTTGAVLANVQLEKGTGKTAYKIPFRLFVVFDKLVTGWSVVHVHFAVPG
jgi:hypothetical protein